MKIATNNLSTRKILMRAGTLIELDDDDFPPLIWLVHPLTKSPKQAE